MNPFRTLRSLRDIARRRPILVGLIGVGMFAEAARVGRVLIVGGSVTVFGHSGGEEWRTADGGADMAAYVLWLAVLGSVLIGFAIAGRRQGRSGVVDVSGSREQTVVAPAAAASRPSATPASAIASRPAGGAVVWRRASVEQRPRHGR